MRNIGIARILNVHTASRDADVLSHEQGDTLIVSNLYVDDDSLLAVQLDTLEYS